MAPKILKNVKGIKLVEDLKDRIKELRTQNPNKRIEVIGDVDRKDYQITVYSDKETKNEIEIPVFLSTQVVYGDSVPGYTPVIVRKKGTNFVQFVRIDSVDSTYQVWSATGFTDIKRVISHSCKKDIFRVHTSTSCVDVTEDHSLVDNLGNLIKPNESKGTQLLTNKPFTKPLSPGFVRVDNRGQYTVTNWVEACKYYHTLDNPCVDIISGLIYVQSDATLKNSDKTILDTVTTVENLGKTCEIVYDLETESGLFHAGIGDIIVKNTDSVMCRFTYNRSDPIQNRYDSFRLAEIAGERLTREIFARPPIEMEFEKVFCPMLLKGKKSYIAKMYDDTRDPLRMTKLHVAGVASKRRNYNEYYKKYADEIYDCLLETHLTDIIPITERYIKDIVSHNVSVDQLVISSLLGATYKTENLPHVHLVKKLKERSNAPQVGDRIPYIFVETNGKDKGTGDVQKYLKVEDPDYAKEHNLRYDRVVYLEHIAKPILGLLAPLLGREYPEILNGVYNTFCDAIKKCGGKKLPITLLKIKEHETV
jgi:hypothetical protein